MHSHVEVNLCFMRFRIKCLNIIQIRHLPKTILANPTKDLWIFVRDIRQVPVGSLAVVIVAQNVPIINRETCHRKHNSEKEDACCAHAIIRQINYGA